MNFSHFQSPFKRVHIQKWYVLDHSKHHTIIHNMLSSQMLITIRTWYRYSVAFCSKSVKEKIAPSMLLFLY